MPGPASSSGSVAGWWVERGGRAGEGWQCAAKEELVGFAAPNNSPSPRLATLAHRCGRGWCTTRHRAVRACSFACSTQQHTAALHGCKLPHRWPATQRGVRLRACCVMQMAWGCAWGARGARARVHARAPLRLPLPACLMHPTAAGCHQHTIPAPNNPKMAQIWRLKQKKIGFWPTSGGLAARLMCSAHTIQKRPPLIRTAKSTWIGPHQYWVEGSPGNPGWRCALLKP